MDKERQFHLENSSVPVVILDSDHYGALGVARTLGRLGVTVYCVDSNPKTINFHSRYCKEGFIYNKVSWNARRTVQFLLNVAKKTDKNPILIPTTDESSLLVADHFDVLKEYYTYHQLSPMLVRNLTNKNSMCSLTKGFGVPTAETFFPRSRDDVRQLLKDVSFPIVLKSIDGRASLMKAGSKMFITKTKEELLQLYDRYENPSNPNYILQEYIPGDEDSVWMFNGYFNAKSECLFGITGKKIRQSPVYTGATSLGVCLKNDVVAKMTKRLMKKIGYRGIIDIGYRYDKRDDKYKVLDINPRIGQTFRLFVATNGLDVARVAYLDLTKQSVPPASICEGRKWVVEEKDVVSSIRYAHDKNLKFWQWVKSFRGVQETAWFAWDDPLPFFLMWKQFFQRATDHLIWLSSSKNRKPFWQHFGLVQYPRFCRNKAICY